MENFKLTVDILSSIASLVAILTVLFSLWRAKLPPLKISQLIISPKQDGLRVFVRIKNRMPYSVKIKGLTCYKKQGYQISRKKLQRPQLWPSTAVNDTFFSFNEDVDVLEWGEFTKELLISSSQFKSSSLLFSLYTSHGILKLKCRNVIEYDKEFEIFNKDEVYLRSNRFTALLAFSKEYLLYLTEILWSKLKIRKLNPKAKLSNSQKKL